MDNIIIETKKKSTLGDFLNYSGFDIASLGDNIYKVTRHEELPVFLQIVDNVIYFEVDLGNISELASKELYFELLDMNTEVLPVSFAINNTNKDDPRLVLVESRITSDLSDAELLGVFDALEIAVDKVEKMLTTKLN